MVLVVQEEIDRPVEWDADMELKYECMYFFFLFFAQVFSFLLS